MIDRVTAPADRRPVRPPSRPHRALTGILLWTLAGVGCSERVRSGRPGPADWWRSGAQPDEMPQVTNPDAPFRYPAWLFARQVEGNVTLRLFLDATGRVITDSTRVEESSNVPALDSAAVAGSALLRFRPARRGGEPIPVAVLFPVHFRHPARTPRADSSPDSLADGPP